MFITIDRITHLVSHIYGNKKCLLVRYGDTIFHAKPGEIEIYFISESRKSVVDFLRRLFYYQDICVSERVRLNTKGGRPLPLDSGNKVKLVKELNGSEITAIIEATYVLNEYDPEYYKCFCDYVDQYLKTENIESEIILPLLIRDIIEIVNHVSTDNVRIFPVVKILLVSRDHSITEKEWTYYDTIHKPIPGTFYIPPMPSSRYLYTISYYADEISQLNTVLSGLKSDINLIVLTRS